MILEKITVKREIVTDWATGKVVKGDIESLGPKKSKITWEMMAWLVEYVVKFCIPIYRVSKMISFHGFHFSSGRICGYLEEAARILLPIYLYLAELLSEASHLSGDDSRSNVVETRKKINNDSLRENQEKLDPLVEQTSEYLPRISKIKSQKRDKKQISISTLIGKSDPTDVRSTIYFYRTHVGDLGNLISHLLSLRKPRNKKLKLTTDLLAANKPDDWLAERFIIEYFGCLSHARRPFYRYRDRDPELCYYILRAFLIVAKIEHHINQVGRTETNIRYFREKYSSKILSLMKIRCEAVMKESRWPPGSSLFDACKYFVTNFETLAKFIFHPEIDPTNNISERILRPEKIMLVSSKFRATEKGRVIIDILRTITMTCSAAEVPVSKYLVYVFKNKKQVSANPKLFTPFAFAKKFDQDNSLKAG